MLFNIHDNRWDPELLQALDIPAPTKSNRRAHCSARSIRLHGLGAITTRCHRCVDVGIGYDSTALPATGQV
jgi:hypothetical protein